jgi:Flp pilus assembly protein CpaB
VLSTVVVAVLVAAFVLVAGVAGWVVRRLWSATGEVAAGGPDAAPAAPVTAQPSTQED